MRLRLSKFLVVGVLASALLATAGSAATTQFATGMIVPETITQTASGGFLVTDATATNAIGKIFSVPAGGGAASWPRSGQQRGPGPGRPRRLEAM